MKSISVLSSRKKVMLTEYIYQYLTRGWKSFVKTKGTLKRRKSNIMEAKYLVNLFSCHENLVVLMFCKNVYIKVSGFLRSNLKIILYLLVNNFQNSFNHGIWFFYSNKCLFIYFKSKTNIFSPAEFINRESGLRTSRGFSVLPFFNTYSIASDSKEWLGIADLLFRNVAIETVNK